VQQQLLDRDRLLPVGGEGGQVFGDRVGQVQLAALGEES
jgi:hypothetical protein